MTVGNKIKIFRTMRGISQKTLGELAGINEATIRKYELGSRNPKPDQLLKITNALGISINLFLDFDIQTVSDVLSLVFKMDEQIALDFDGEKDEKGKIDPKTLTIRFKDGMINNRLSQWAYAKELLQKTINARDEFDNEEAYNAEVQDMKDKCEEIKQHLVDSNVVVDKVSEGIKVKVL